MTLRFQRTEGGSHRQPSYASTMRRRLFVPFAFVGALGCQKVVVPPAPIGGELVKVENVEYFKCPEGQSAFVAPSSNTPTCLPAEIVSFTTCVQQISIGIAEVEDRAARSKSAALESEYAAASAESAEERSRSANTVISDSLAAARGRAIDWCVKRAEGAAGLTDAPIGAVLPFFLTPNEARELAPNWLPADGKPIPKEIGSPLGTQRLPDLQRKFIRGATIDQNVVPEDATNSGGTAKTTQKVAIEAASQTGGKVAECKPPNVTIDTGLDELNCGKILATGEVTVDLAPPYRDLIYLVRVR